MMALGPLALGASFQVELTSYSGLWRGFGLWPAVDICLGSRYLQAPLGTLYLYSNKL